MTPEQIARIDAESDAFHARLCDDPGMARYLDERSQYERRRLGLPVIEYKRKGQEE